ncbi:Y-family DNA polymerase (plasmid) [Vibrio scophthalmi]|uniref:Y-family DNA polymerase n=1 Tax=Vibrio scophthalmi TaxID=45658 RepID=UPI003EC0A645
MIALIDANSYYCSAESVYNPKLRGKPLIILSNNDGCVVAANRLALSLGVKKFEPYFKLKSLCELKGIVAKSSNYELYADLSSKMMDVISRFGPDQNVYSIDESFLSFRRAFPAIPCLTTHLHNLRKTVWKECRIPVSAGAGKTITLSKIASHAAKNLGYNGVCVLEDQEEIDSVLKQIPVGKTWGVGRQLSSRMFSMGINTAYDLANTPIKQIERNFSVDIVRTVMELRGQECFHYDGVRFAKKQIYSTCSVSERITDLISLEQALTKHACIAVKKARNQGSLVKVVQFFSASSPFDTDHRSFRFLHEFDYATNDSLVLSQIATQAAKSMFKPGVRYYKIGVGLINLISEEHYQNDLFNPVPVNDKLMKTFDALNTKYGADALFVASQGIDQKWAMKRNMLSPCYTTRWRDIPKIRC